MNHKKLTIVLTTNPVEGWTPSTKLIEHTVNQPHLSPLHQSQWIVCCDTDDAEHEYYQALSSPGNLTCLQNKQVTHNTPDKHGLKWSIINSAELINTEYVLFLEHDWIFKREVDWDNIIQTMDQYSFIHMISFNKHSNTIQTKGAIPFRPDDPVVTEHIRSRILAVGGENQDTYMEVDSRLKNAPINLVKALRWSNNPYIARTNKYKQWVSFINDGENGTRCKGVEAELIKKFRHDCYTTSWTEAHAQWGVYLYGSMGEHGMVRHLNGKLLRFR